MLNITGGEREEHFVRAVAQFVEHKYVIHSMFLVTNLFSCGFSRLADIYVSCSMMSIA
jgi:hypothetical protein